MELDERLATGRRSHHRPADLLRAATAGGADALGWPDAGRLQVGMLADFVSVRARLGASGRHPTPQRRRLPGVLGNRERCPPRRRRRRRRGPRWPPPVGGRRRRARRHHRGSGFVTSTVIDHIGLLVTNDPTLGDGPLGLVREAAVVLDGDRVVAIERAGVSADVQIDAGGRCVIPGFVDSHTHLVFGGDRADEFAARMAGRPYAASGILTTVAATRATTTEELTTLAVGRLAGARRDGTTHVEVKSGYGLTVADESRILDVATRVTDDVTFLGAHAVPPEFEGRADAYVAHVCDEMVPGAAGRARWIDVFCEQRRVRRGPVTGRARGWSGRRARVPRARQPARARARRPPGRRAGRGVGRSLHLPRRRRPRRPGGERDRGHVPAGHRLLHPSALPGCPAGDRRRGQRRPGQQLQPGIELHDVHAVLPGARRAATCT